MMGKSRLYLHDAVSSVFAPAVVRANSGAVTTVVWCVDVASDRNLVIIDRGAGTGGVTAAKNLEHGKLGGRKGRDYGTGSIENHASIHQHAFAVVRITPSSTLASIAKGKGTVFQVHSCE